MTRMVLVAGVVAALVVLSSMGDGARGAGLTGPGSGPVEFPDYNGSSGCSTRDYAACQSACDAQGPPGFASGNWFAQRADCERVDHPLDPENPKRYGLSCTCAWWDGGCCAA